jgi:hypothetical protein
LKQIELLNWTLALNPSLHRGSSNHELSFLAFFFFVFFIKIKVFKPIDFPSKMVPCRFSLNFATFWSWTHPHIKAMGSIYELQSMTTYIAHPFLGGPNSDENP